MPSKDTVADLLARIAKNDTAAFESLYRLTSARLSGACLRILKDPGDAEDALQDSFVKIWLSAGQFGDADGSAEAWLFAVARHTSIDRLRTLRGSFVEIDAILELADQSPGPEVAAIVNNDNEVLRGFLDRLPPEKAAAVRGAYLNGDSYKELARRHNVPLNTMRTLLRRSLKQLRKSMKSKD